MKEYNTYIMQIGEGMAGALKAPEKKKYTRIDKRTKKYGNPYLKITKLTKQKSL